MDFLYACEGPGVEFAVPCVLELRVVDYLYVDCALPVAMASPRKKQDQYDISDDEGMGDKAKKPKTEGSLVTLEMGALRALLQEQSEQITKAQQQNMDAALRRMEDKHQALFSTMHSRLDQTDTKVEDLQSVVTRLQDRLTALEKRPSPSTTSTSEGADRDRSRTLVYGGWERGTRRPVILQDLARALKQLGLEEQIDSEAFTTGPRRSVALMHFLLRRDETHEQLRQRMHQVVKGFVEVQPHSSQQKRMWCSFSKPVEVRRKGAHAAWMKRALTHMETDFAAKMVDFEYHSGSVWVADAHVAGVEPADSGKDPKGLYVDDKNPDRPWFDLKSLARVLGRPQAAVEEAIQHTRR